MTVWELLEKLFVLPWDTEVLVADWNEAYKPPTPLTSVVFHKESSSVVLEEE